MECKTDTELMQHQQQFGCWIMLWRQESWLTFLSSPVDISSELWLGRRLAGLSLRDRVKILVIWKELGV